MNSILEINNLKKNYKNFTLDNISFKLEPGFIMGFIGPNGAGKSTTIKLIMNLIHKDGGEIKVFGKDNITYEKEIKQKIGFVYDENHYYEDLNAKETEYIISPFYKRWDSKIFKKYCKDFDIDMSKKIKSLSKGMKMKLALAVALSHNADLIIMDEPTSGLDPVFRSEILEILQFIIQNDQKSIFFSSHITNDLEKIADYITFLNDGKIIFSETKDDILAEYAIIKGDNKLLDDKEYSKIFIGIKKNSFGFQALTKNIKLAKEYYGNKILIEKATLEDIMVHYAKH